MAQLGHFDPDAVVDEAPREPLPPGVYTAQVIESDLVALKSGNGQMLKLTLEIVEGACAKRRVFDNLNIQHSNAQAQDIAQRALKRLCLAVGHQGVLSDSESLHFKPFRVRLSVEEDRSGQYGPQNRVKAYDGLGGAAPVAHAQATSAPVRQTASVAGGSRPWASR